MDSDLISTLLDELSTVKQTHDRLFELVSALQRAPHTSAPQACRLSREGDYWTIAYRGSVVRLRDAKGLGYLARLFARPGVEIHALELVDGGDLGDAGPALDARAKSGYRARLEGLRSRLDDARAFGDDCRAGQLESEIVAIAQALSDAVGLGGRDRKSASAAERARVNVTRNLKAAIARIAEVHAELGRHCNASVRTGTFCCYEPRAAVTWAVT
jgi:hypothetical protein